VVVRRNHVIYMLYDETIIGAEFDDDDYRWQTAYPGFAIMQSAAYLDRTFTHAAQIGLGIGTVPTFLRGKGIPTDVIEISDAVVTQAANYFQYERCEDDDPEDCVNGKTFVVDGLAFLKQEPKSEADKYDLFITDVYTGWNPLAFFTQEIMVSVRDKWLASPKGVFVCNFVGMFNGPHAVVPKSIYRTLQSVFKHVKAFRYVFVRV
jgi:spermidine synthase